MTARMRLGSTPYFLAFSSMIASYAVEAYRTRPVEAVAGVAVPGSSVAPVMGMTSLLAGAEHRCSTRDGP
jgi:hypothetical protein